MSQEGSPRERIVASVVREMLEANLGTTVFDPSPNESSSAITCHFDGTSLTVVSTGESGGALSVAVTAGLGREVPVSSDLIRWVNEKNQSIKFGRVFYVIGQDPNLCVVLLQEYVSADYVRADDFESQLAVLAMVGPTMASGWSLATELVGTFGGRYFGRGDAAFILFLS
jgi:aspartokinase